MVSVEGQAHSLYVGRGGLVFYKHLYLLACFVEILYVFKMQYVWYVQLVLIFFDVFYAGIEFGSI